MSPNNPYENPLDPFHDPYKNPRDSTFPNGFSNIRGIHPDDITILNMMNKIETDLNIIDTMFQKTNLKNDASTINWDDKIKNIKDVVNRLKQCCDLQYFATTPPGSDHHLSRADLKINSINIHTTCEALLTSIQEASNLKAESTTEEIEGDPTELLEKITSLTQFASCVSFVMNKQSEELKVLLIAKEQKIKDKIELFRSTYSITDTVGYILQDYKAIKASLVELHGQQQALCYDYSLDKSQLQEKQKNQIDDLDSIVIATCERLEKPAKTKGPK